MVQPAPYVIVPILGPDGCGKSSLMDAMWRMSGSTPRDVLVAGRSARVMDLSGGTRTTQLVDFVDQATELALLASAGASAALLVVSALDAIVPGTRSSLEMAAGLGLPIAAVALTKCDLVDDVELTDLVTMEIQDMLAKVRMSQATPIIKTTSLEVQRERAREDDPIFGARRLLQLLAR
jgi:translation elongation factor EF-Tu-like GTPase